MLVARSDREVDDARRDVGDEVGVERGVERVAASAERRPRRGAAADARAGGGAMDERARGRGGRGCDVA